MNFGNVALTQMGSVRLIEMISEDGMNCYTPEMGEDLVVALREAASDDATAAIILTGRGRAFCAGAHRNTLSGEVGPSGFRIGEEEFIRSFAPEFSALPKLVIAAFNGSAAGIGVTMSLLCDLRLAVPGIKLRFNFAELGVMPGLGSTAMLARLIGLPAAKRLLLCDRLILSEEALKTGLLDEIVPPAQLLARAHALGEQAAGCRKGMLAELKSCLNAALDGNVADAVQREAASAARLRGVR